MGWVLVKCLIQWYIIGIGRQIQLLLKILIKDLLVLIDDLGVFYFLISWNLKALILNIKVVSRGQLCQSMSIIILGLI